MSGNRKNFSSEGFIKPTATVAAGAFLLSPLGIPFFVRGVPRIILAGIGAFVAGAVADKVADTFAENLGHFIPSQKPEDNAPWPDES